MQPERIRQFAALGDAQRVRLVEMLAERRDASITELAQGSGVTRQAVTRHLQVLADAGWVQARTEGRERRWELDPTAFEAAEAEIDRLKSAWRQRLARLKLFVERDE